jgi:hypothetical protein
VRHVIFLETSVETPLGNVVFTPELPSTARAQHHHDEVALDGAERRPLVCRWVTGDDGRLVSRWVPQELLVDPCRQVAVITNWSSRAVA